MAQNSQMEKTRDNDTSYPACKRPGSTPQHRGGANGGINAHIRDERNNQICDKTWDDESTVSKEHGGHKDKMLPKGLCGCETAPANESAMRTFRSEVVNAATYTTKRRSTDITFAVASNGSDIGPEVEVYVRRLNGFRRALVTDSSNKDMIKEILLEYRKNEELGTML